MKKIIKNIVLILFVVLLSSNVKSQTHTFSTDIDWFTTNQNMWGPNGSPFNININLNLFHVYYDTSMTIGYMQSVIGGQIGANVNIDTWFELGSTFEMTGFTTGWLDVYYPVRVNLTFPNNYTWNPGQTVTINSDYEVLSGWGIDSHFPQAGVISLDLDFGFGLDIDAEVCMYSCDTFNLVNVNVPTDSIVLFYINGQTGEVIYPCANNGSFGFCHDTLLPITFTNFANTGLSGEITIPYIETVDHLDTSDVCHKSIIANGDSTWADFDLDVIQFLSFIAGFLPPPQGPAIQQFLAALNGSYNLGGGISIDYSLLTADLNFSSTMQQDLTFSPTVWSNLSFPTPVEYTVTEPHNANTMIDSGVSDSISFPACDDLNIKWPCFDWPSMDVGINHSISPTITNHTWDSLAFSFALTALEFTINIPFPIIAPMEIPGFCLPLPRDTFSIGINPIDTIQNPSMLDTRQRYFCSDQISLPGTDTSMYQLKGLKWSYHIGPLVNLNLPIGYIPITWYNNTWDLAGFQDTTIAPTVMIANPEMTISSISSTDIWCSGDSSGTMIIEVQYGTAPYTYSWSDGTVHNSGSQIDSLVNVPAGNYTVTVSDVNGCSLDTAFTLIELDPPMYITLSSTDVLCRGDSTGTISAAVVGGTPGYTYNWIPMGGNSTFANQVPAGLYTFEVTDAVGCVETDTISINEPDSSIILNIDNYVDILCNGGNNGSIDLSAIGGTPPYTYYWSNGATSQDISNLTAGTYTASVIDANGCLETISQTLLEPLAIDITNNITQVSCFGGGDGSIDITVSGGTQPYSYIWTTGDTSQDINTLTTGNYSVTVTDANNCQSVAAFNVPQPAAPLTATISGVDILCFGDSTGSVNLEPTGGTFPYVYNWSNGATTQDLSNVPAGNYQVTITDFFGCTYLSQITLTEPQASLNVVPEITDVRCNGEDNGSIVTSVSGGTQPYNYLWSNSSTASYINALVEGNYNVTVTDSHGCEFILENLHVNEPEELVTSITPSQYICIGQEINIWAAATGGTYPYSFVWNNGILNNNFNATPTSTISYNVVVTDAHNCVSTQQTTIYVNPPLSGNLSLSDDTICPGESVIIDVLNVSGGDGYYTYTIDSTNVSLPYYYYPSGTGAISLILGDNCGSPTLLLDTSVFVLPAPPVMFSADNLAGCPPVYVNFHINNFIQGNLYNWNFGDENGLHQTSSQNMSHTYNYTGVYDVSVYTENENGCTSFNMIPQMISVYDVPEAKFDASPGVIESLNPEISFTNLSVGANSYLWDFGDNDTSSKENPIHQYVNNNFEGYDVSLVVENRFGCTDTASQHFEMKNFYTFWAPDAFSPDGDGVNDIFICKGVGINNNTFNFIIYNRWGEPIFETNDLYTGWDGRVADKSKLSEMGSYTWIAHFKDNSGEKHIRWGVVTLIR